ncbi:hypothetical protein [Vibrio crassostreae]|uniref:hypothetical protein n=1 Tax=Vibrio crassostreae TaxID=246167 RepID=UPI001B309211|nr:hypothetical protein [Vibrio crassostreae]
MLKFEGKYDGSTLVIHRVVSDLMGTTISVTYKKLSGVEIPPLNTQDELERWYETSKSPECYSTIKK